MSRIGRGDSITKGKKIFHMRTWLPSLLKVTYSWRGCIVKNRCVPQWLDHEIFCINGMALKHDPHKWIYIHTELQYGKMQNNYYNNTLNFWNLPIHMSLNCPNPTNLMNHTRTNLAKSLLSLSPRRSPKILSCNLVFGPVIHGWTSSPGVELIS